MTKGYNIGFWESTGDGKANVFDLVPNQTRLLHQQEVSHDQLKEALGCSHEDH